MRRRTLHRSLVLALCAAVLVAGSAAADPQKEYKNGLNALDDSRFPDAERYFRSAIKERSEERLGGVLRRVYLPHYYLGVALMKQNRCREALAAWEESERQGQAAKAENEGREFPRNKELCRERIQAFDASRSVAEQALASARKAAEGLARLRETRELLAVWKQGNPSFSSREDAARGKLEEATRLFGAVAGEDPSPFQQAKALAYEAATELDLIKSDAQERLGKIHDVASSARERLDDAEKKARAALEEIRFLQPYPPVLASLVEKAEQALAESAGAKAKTNASSMERLQETLSEAAESLEKASVGPPSALRGAVASFLAGNYEEVIDALEGQSYRDRRAAGQVCLLRAASRFELYTTGGEQDWELGAALHADVLGCRGLMAAADIPGRFFSPRFVGYYENPPAQPPEPPAEPEATDDEAAHGEAETPATPAPAEDEQAVVEPPP